MTRPFKHSNILFQQVIPSQWNEDTGMLFGAVLTRSTDLIIIYMEVPSGYAYKVLRNRFDDVRGEIYDLEIISGLLRKAYGVKPAQPEIQRMSGQRFG